MTEGLESLLEEPVTQTQTPTPVATIAASAESDKTTIPCKKTTRIRVKDYGKKGESYDHLLNRIMDMIEQTPRE
jgi:hypothetical protein